MERRRPLQEAVRCLLAAETFEARWTEADFAAVFAAAFVARSLRRFGGEK